MASVGSAYQSSVLQSATSSQAYPQDRREDEIWWSWDEVCERLERGGGNPLAGTDGHSLGALEALWWRVSLFEALCQALERFHHQVSHPHLALCPRLVRVQPWGDSSPTPQGLPPCALELVSSEASAPISALGIPPEMAQSIFVPPASLDGLYASPDLRDWPMGREVSTTVLIQSMDRLYEEEENEQSIRGIIKVALVGDALAQASFCERDVFHLTVTLRGATIPCRLWGRKVEAEHRERGLVLAGVCDGVEPAQWDHWQEWQHEVYQGTAKVYRAFGVSCDIYSLGLLLFHALLGTSSRPFFEIEPVIRHVAATLEPIVEGVEPGSAILYNRLAVSLKEAHMMFVPSPVVPEDLWYGALLLGFRLVSGISGFSAAAPVNLASRTAAQILGEVTQRAHAMTTAVDIELFQAEERNQEIRRACQLLRQEWAAAQ